MRASMLFNPRNTPLPGTFLFVHGTTLVSGIPLSEDQARELSRVLGVDRILVTSVFKLPYPGAFLLPLPGGRIGVHAGLSPPEEEALERVFELERFVTPETVLGNAVAILGMIAVVHTTASSALKDTLRQLGFTLLELTHETVESPGAYMLRDAHRVLISPLIPEHVQRFIARETGLTPVPLTLRGEHAIARMMLRTAHGVVLPSGVLTEELFRVMEG